ncbi:diguanylate cyclase [Butyrivibrio sp. WCD3002]|uniref:diguanylate cyclase n=1 Tax=Butyrivibrio sp. WCD3002 TaxID=1280676 RepID=UPI0003F88F82|nr:diguanylate cyclase [Butyrivibrio sp. WCD3002]
MSYRNDCVIARVPSAYGENNSIHFTSDVIKGEKFRLSYGNADNLLAVISKSVEGMKSFKPEAVFLFECGNRVRFLKERASCETNSYKEITSEFSVAIGYAELFMSSTGDGGALNSAMVAVGLSENSDMEDEIRACVNLIEDDDQNDERDYIPFIDRILHFLERTSTELDAVNKELGRIAYTDQLTKVYNRWELEHKINEVLDFCNTDNTPACLIFMDIDHFKHVNDTYGHDVGDMVLRASVDVIRENLGPRHVFGRWGGEEFIYVLTDMEISEAAEFAENLRKQIEESYFETVKHITMSFGVGQNKPGDNLESFVKRADEALYIAKESGRNRVVRRE